MMSPIVKIVDDAKGWDDFLQLPQRIYKDDPKWVAPLISEVKRTLDNRQNPYFTDALLQAFVCYKSSVPVARVVVIINKRYWRLKNCNSAFFGFYECIHDPEVSDLLFETAAMYAKQHGATSLEGPFNPNHYSELGLLVSNFNSPPRFFETYNPDYYQELLEHCGFLEMARLHTRINQSLRIRTKYVRSINQRHVNSAFSIRPFNMRDMKNELARIREVNEDAFADNIFFAPVSMDEYQFAAKHFSFVTRPELVLIVEREDEPVGVLQCALNINKILKPLKGKIRFWQYPGIMLRKYLLREIVIISVGIKKKYRNTDVFSLLLEGMCGITKKYAVASTTWMCRDNIAALRAAEVFALKSYKWFAMYQKQL